MQIVPDVHEAYGRSLKREVRAIGAGVVPGRHGATSRRRAFRRGAIMSSRSSIGAACAFRPSAICLAVLLVGLTISLPAAAHCKGKHAPPPGEPCPVHDEGGVGSDLEAIGAVGHSLGGTLPCDYPNDSSLREGDFYDLGTADRCELLTCTAGTNQVVCGTQSHPKPKININGLFDLWPQGGKGKPETCFGDGVITTPVQAVDSGGDSAIRLMFYFEGDPDPNLPGCEDAIAVVSYVAEFSYCQVQNGPYPPTSGSGESIVACPTNTPIEIRTEGGGRIAKKCGCVASGFLGSDTLLRFQVASP